MVEYPEFVEFIKKMSEPGIPEYVGAVEYEQGYEAFTEGRNFTDNPYSDETARHAAWQAGWFQAFDERGDIAPE